MLCGPVITGMAETCIFVPFFFCGGSMARMNLNISKKKPTPKPSSKKLFIPSIGKIINIAFRTWQLCSIGPPAYEEVF